MTDTFDPQRDLKIERIIGAPRQAVWRAWTDPAQFEQWWIPAPIVCKVIDMDLKPGGSFVTTMREGDGDFQPHIDGCFLAVDEGARIVFTTALVGGWRPAENPFMTAVITMQDHPDGTAYTALAMHKSPAASAKHAELGFYDGWGTVTEQLARLVERT